ncbi:MAG TPA: hypothetical protein VLE94_20315 [Burkholderiaceae bacterium]|nr:hypothetical protein [Burkholderiaceae bacterium]
MTNDLLASLDALASAATNDLDRWSYRAQHACALARLGRIEAARAEIRSLREYNTAYSPRLTGWIFLAEGMCDHFESLSTDAIDRFKRAHGLAAATNDPEIKSLAAAWIGASEFLMGRHEAAALHAAEAIEGAPANGALALSRGHLVLANCLYGFGAEAVAAKHYAKARHFAVEARDISMQSAILYNVAAFRLWRLTLEDAFGEPLSAKEVRLAELEVNSIGNLDHGLEIASLEAMVPLLRAQVRLISGQWADADTIYAESIDGGARRLAPRYMAERAHCNAMLDRRDRALDLASEAQRMLGEGIELDDRAACHARLARIFEVLGLAGEAAAQAKLARETRAAFRAYQESLRPRLASISASVS